MKCENKGEKAALLFRQGYNCAQSVVLAFAEELKEEYGLEEKALAKLASSFGGGMGRLREVCGAVSGMFMVYGMFYGYDSPTPEEDEAMQAEKDNHYKMIQQLAEEFKQYQGTIICREILDKPEGADDYHAAKRTNSYYEERPCEKCVYHAAEILEKFLKN